MSDWRFEDYLSAVNSLKSQRQSFVIITLVKQIGSSPQDVGARALVSAQGLQWGTVGGGKVENRAILEAQKMLREKIKHRFVDWNLQKDIGMTCGGVVSFFFELIESENPMTVAVFGAGHIAQELVRLLLHLDFRIVCIDSRQEWIEKLPESPRLNKICTADMRSQVNTLPQGSFVTIMTMGHGTDLPILTQVLRERQRWAYVGNIGSELKRRRLEKDLLEAGLSSEVLNQFFCPMGENFGDNSPAEIAFSIVAQILKIRDQANPPSSSL